MPPQRIAVLASGGGTNLQALLDDFNTRGDAPGQVALVLGSRSGIGALHRAARAGVPAFVAKSEDADSMLARLEDHRIHWVVLAGYLRRVPVAVVDRFAGRMVNIHPALLPAFGGAGMYGRRVHQAVLASGATVSGPTVHRVGHEYDTGVILAQWPVPVLPDDTPETLATRVQAVEHVLLPAVLERLLIAEPPAVTTAQAPTAFDFAGVPADASIRRMAANARTH